MAMITSAVYRMYFDETSFSVETVTFRNVTISNRFHLYIIKKTPPNLTICDGAKNENHLLPRYSCYFESDCYVAGTFCGTIRNSSPPLALSRTSEEPLEWGRRRRRWMGHGPGAAVTACLWSSCSCTMQC